MTSQAKNKVLVMGASSSAGIGAAIARRFAEAGDSVVISARNESNLADVGAGLGVKTHPCDITDPASVAALFAWIKEHHGPLTTAVFATGQNFFTPISRYEADSARSCVETNFLGALTFIRNAAEVMPEGGSIVVLSSLTATRPAFGTAVYAGTKAALDQATRVAALEYAGQGIRINGIAPGMTRTDMTEMMFDNPNLEQAVLKEIPLGRMGTADDIAAAAVWLADPSCFMTGETLAVNGGAELCRVPTLEEIMG